MCPRDSSAWTYREPRKTANGALVQPSRRAYRLTQPSHGLLLAPSWAAAGLVCAHIPPTTRPGPSLACGQCISACGRLFDHRHTWPAHGSASRT
jgi:hypothetical protein